MKIGSMWAAALAACLGGCAMPRMSMPPPPQKREVPARSPSIQIHGGRVVPYPGLDVSYVEGADFDCYLHRDVYYCFYEAEWYYAKSLSGPWNHVEMKYVPPALYRAHGNLPPGAKPATRRGPAVRPE